MYPSSYSEVRCVLRPSKSMIRLRGFMSSFSKIIETSSAVLTEGGVVERIKRNTALTLDPWIAHAGLIYHEEGRKVLEQLYTGYMEIGRMYGLPFMSLAPTWRVNPERLKKSGYSACENITRDCVDLLKQIRTKYNENSTSIFIGGVMACRGDAYRPEEALSKEDAVRFHKDQAIALAECEVDFIQVATLPALTEAYGMASVLSHFDIPYILSFVIRPEGTLLDGTPIYKAIELIDKEIDPKPHFYMVNCVHPNVFLRAMDCFKKRFQTLKTRILGLQANSSSKGPEELDKLDFLDTSAPEEFADAMVSLHRQFGTKVLGGCCGTNDSHIGEIAKRLVDSNL